MSFITPKEIEIQSILKEIKALNQEYKKTWHELRKYIRENNMVNWTYGKAYQKKKDEISRKLEEKYRELAKLDPLRFNRQLNKYAHIFT